MPSIWELGQGCAFRERCRFAIARCGAEVPPMFGVGSEDGHAAACFRVAYPEEFRP